MIKHILKIDFEAEEGALVRLIGLVQRRGFDVLSMALPESAHMLKTMHLTVSPRDAVHRIDVLQRQLERLHEVRGVTLVAPKPPRNMLGFLKGPIVGLQNKTVLSAKEASCLPVNSSHVS